MFPLSLELFRSFKFVFEQIGSTIQSTHTVYYRFYNAVNPPIQFQSSIPLLESRSREPTLSLPYIESLASELNLSNDILLLEIG